jgi:hypothetical protein
MTLYTSDYALGSNYPLNHARILYAPFTGTVTAGGTNGDYAANDYTNQRWDAPAGVASWGLDAGLVAPLDTIFIAAHNLSGATIKAQLSGQVWKNMALWSEALNEGIWGKTRASITKNATAIPAAFGSFVVADKLVEDTTATNTHFTVQAVTAVSGTYYTLSVYAKAGERTHIRPAFSSSTGVFPSPDISTIFNLSNGTIFGGTAGAGAVMEDLGGGWYRCSITAQAIATGSVNFILGLHDGTSITYTGDGTSGLYLWGAQFEAAEAVTDYVPRFGSSETVTNAALQSETFDNASWTKTRVTISANVAEAPDGTTSADKLVEDGTVANTHLMLQQYAVTSGTYYTYSIYAKAAERTHVRLNFGGDNGAFSDAGAVFDLSDGSVFNQTAGIGAVIEDIGDGLYRCSATALALATVTGVLRTELHDGTSVIYDGDGASGIYVWGAQFQTGSMVTTYIKTTTAPVASAYHDITSWLSVPDTSTIAIMANSGGVAYQTQKFRIVISEGTGKSIGIIRGGAALQMSRPVFGGVRPIGLNRAVETRHSITETGQWLGRTIQRQAATSEMSWMHLTAEWYRANFKAFAEALPQTPFGLIQNPSKMPESVAWCWTDQVPQPENMGIRDFMQVSLPVTGFLE